MTDWTRRAPDLPISLRRTVGSRVATAMLVGAPLSLVVALVAGDTGDLAWHVLQTVALSGLAATILYALPRTSGRRTEWVLAALSLGLLASVVVGGLAAQAHDGRVAALAFLALALLITSITLRRWLHDLAMVATVAVAPAAVAAAGPQARITGWMLLGGVTVGVLSRLTATALAGALEARRLAEQETTDHAAAMATVLRAVRATVGATPDEVLQAVVDATEGLGADSAALYLVRADGMLGLAGTRAIPDNHRAALPPGDGLPGEVLRRQELVHLEDYRGFDGAVPSLLDADIRVAVGVPVRLPDGRVLAVLTAGRRDTRPFPRAALDAFEVLADDVARALESSRAVDADRRTLRAVAALHERQADFVATISHELRTPVTVIGGMTATLDRLGQQVPEHVRDEMIGRIHRQAQALETVVEGLLDASRLAGGLSARLAELDLARLVANGIEASHMPCHPVTLQVTGNDTVVRGDEHLLAGVVENLLDNASTHTPPGTPVRVLVHGDGGRVRLTVADDGPGIPPHDLHGITQRFVRAGDVDTRSSRGLGVGLAFVSEVLRLHDTTLEVVSQEGCGASFGFSLRRSDQQLPPDVRSAVDEVVAAAVAAQPPA